jgi:predicted MFS family arabinose efflux permease
MSITMSGLIAGLVMGRVLGGVIAEETSWRNTYWLAVALQGGKSDVLSYSLTPAMLLVLYFALPDTPDKNLGLNYLQIVCHFGAEVDR